MKTVRLVRLLFAVAAIYDGGLGAAFLVAPGAVFRHWNVTPPNHPGYIQFPATLLIVFAIMFLAVAADPVRRRAFIPYGMLLKASYCGVVLLHWLTAGLPDLWKPFCIADLAFFAAFAWAWTALRDPRTLDTVALRPAGTDILTRA